MIVESVDPSPYNKKLSEALRLRADSELFSAEATKWFWYAGGISVIFFVLCCVFYLITISYFNLNKKDDFTILAQSIEDGLKNVVLKAETSGSVNLLSEPLKLRDGQIVRIDPNSKLNVAKNSEITVRGDIPITLPDVKLFTSSQNNSRNSVMTPSTYFTVFKSVPYRDGYIQTGWRYLTAIQDRPSIQYCYFNSDLSDDGSNASWFFATNGQIDANVIPPKGFDVQDAFRRCIWFEGN